MSTALYHFGRLGAVKPLVDLLADDILRKTGIEEVAAKALQTLTVDPANHILIAQVRKEEAGGDDIYYITI